VGGSWGFGCCPWAGSAAQPPAWPFAWRGGLPLPGGGLFPSPSPRRGPVVPGQAGSRWGPCPAGLCREPPALSLTPGLRSHSARVRTVPRGHVPRGRAGRGASGCPRVRQSRRAVGSISPQSHQCQGQGEVLLLGGAEKCLFSPGIPREEKQQL